MCYFINLKFEMNLLKAFLYFLKHDFWRVSISLAYILSLQILTGIPKPDSVQKLNISSLAIRLSEELFQYPFWLQDLSHLPLFSSSVGFPIGCLVLPKVVHYKRALLFRVSMLFFFNEGIQALIPDRFPSFGDLIMNLLGTFAESSAIDIFQKNKFILFAQRLSFEFYKSIYPIIVGRVRIVKEYQ